PSRAPKRWRPGRENAKNAPGPDDPGASGETQIVAGSDGRRALSLDRPGRSVRQAEQASQRVPLLLRTNRDVVRLRIGRRGRSGSRTRSRSGISRQRSRSGSNRSSRSGSDRTRSNGTGAVRTTGVAGRGAGRGAAGLALRLAAEQRALRLAAGLVADRLLTAGLNDIVTASFESLLRVPNH